MKKISFIACLLLVSICMVRAQADRVSIGVNVAGNYAGYIYDKEHQINTPKSKIGYGAALSVVVAVAPRINIETGLQYDALKYGVNVVMDPYSPTRTYGTKDYLTLPILFQYEFGPKQMFYVNVGPVLEFNLSHRQRMEFEDNYVRDPNTGTNGLIPAFSSTIDLSYKERKVVLAMAVGLGMKVPLVEKLDFVWEARFTGDLTNINNKSEAVEQFRLLNFRLRAGLAYRF